MGVRVLKNDDPIRIHLLSGVGGNQKSTRVLHETFTFPGGEIQVRVERGYWHPSDRLEITADVCNSASIMELFLVTDAVRHLYPNVPIDLVMPYLPYARQDRVCASGEAFSLKVMCDLINAQGYASVTVWDGHSKETMARLANGRMVEAHRFVAHIPNKSTTTLIAPDAGAHARVKFCAGFFGMKMVSAEKTRDPLTGKITGTVVHSGSLGDADLLIVDDICDGGRTFIELAKVLRPLTTGKINLYVTHGIFSQGFDVFNGLIDHIYVANPFPGTLPDFVTVLEL